MTPLLTDVDVRVLGALAEKESTTPDVYPLSLNGLISACNQSSNRTPVVAYEEPTVIAALNRLRIASLVRGIQRSDSRVMKYQHLLDETLGLSRGEVAVLTVLMLRGPQTVAELRTRTERLAQFESVADVENTLHGLMTRTEAALVTRLPRQPGQKEVRYAHLLSGEVSAAPAPAPEVVQAPTATGALASAIDRIAALEEMVQEMHNEMADLRAQLETFRKQFE